ncbi:MAG TPA: ATP synthase F1 subunit epsilon [Aliidongia sp.]|uniref:ATP synthase F1 subunit epsilon n=1 Tax=Aliidongia sp. TaxID=1914230 RepID=UPI002DDCF833|nr:ATP synthase F1 subunit epsilon [Aliidongia sp.]HEV2677844.1 ATP synthase F1 subunit epsilon [Aliidongia sp.]
MAEKVKFELVSPEKILLSEAVEMVVIPGAEGNFGVLPGHAPLISSVRPGTIEVYEGSTIAERIFIAGGFAEVTPERCTVLADEAVTVSSLDRGAVEAELAAATTRYGEALAVAEKGNDTDKLRFKAAERQLAVATAKHQAVDASVRH